MTQYPDIRTAIALWQESLTGVNARVVSQRGAREYIYHTTGVAEAAAAIAAKCGMNEEKAYVVGLLHDWGKIQDEKASGQPHFLVGYDKMIAEGWADAAQICLTHSFPEKDFKFSDYPSYSSACLQKTKDLISKIEYDDYDRLIQLCDIFFEATSKISYQRRIARIRERYNLTVEQTKCLEIKAAENKAYFDAKCGCDVYDLLGIKE